MKENERKKAIKDEFTQLYNEYQSSVYRLCLAKLGSDVHTAEDCTQNAFIVLYKKMLNNEEITYPKAFLYKTANNFILKSLSQIARERDKTIPLENCENTVGNDERQIDNEIDYELLKQKIYSVLNEEEKNIFEMKYINCLTIEQISKQTQLSAPAVAKRLQRMRDKIKNSISIE